MALQKEWKKSTFSAGGQCVEAKCGGITGEHIEVRHSKGLPTFNKDEWRAFVAGVKAGEFDV